eukprot:CAMPEP_0206555238 /NCGR_PEP_ID=MMETSP0325_2-20121206/17663_1 /ASSEMBLY_ACC=CAM_ASM_000347 /TAXON_ID=2866 /ORGANISM="Crypthecodinium cohnii, Strain Seligo" /LENGTH=744 /DNA_ID=CAMNT_0054055477 /DNA_START=56 /DNA_END=2290 /DNA_ORIENTATION=+
MRRACATSLRLARNAAARHSVAEFLLPAAASLSSSSASTGSRRCFSYLAERDSSRLQTYRRRAAQLQRTVDADPKNQQKLADLLRVLNHFDPQQAIRVFERQEPTVAFESDTCVREYIRALVLSNRLDYVDLDLLLRRNWADVVRTAKAQPAEDGSSAHVATAIELRLPDNGEPLKVQVSDSNRRALWRLLRSLMTFLIMVAGVSVFAEGFAGNVQKGVSGFGMGAKKVTPVKEVTTSFDDVKGCDEVKEELQEIILYLKDPDRFTRLGAKLPKGMMMSGSPGTGKTLLARAIAGEAGVPFLQASGSEFEEMFVGVGARRIRDLFTEARKHAPCIVFIDEIDAVGSKRSNRDNTAVRMTLNQLLVELDGFEQNNGIVVICATNFPESLDKALTRPGRLDKQVVVPVPDLKGRLEILRLYADKLVLDKNVNLETLARRTAGMTGADLFNILNIAAVRSSAEGLAAVPMKYLETAFDRVVVGLERTNPMSDEEKRLTAFHEGGHTLVSLQNKGADPVHKATIMPRGNALGITWSIPEREKYSERLFELQARLEVLMGGKAAEELIFGPKNVTAGCTSDLRAATGLARRMVMNFGMSSADGEPGTLYMEVDDYAVLSDEAKHDIDKKTQTLLTNAYTRAAKLLKDHEKELRSLAEALIEYETLSAEEIQLAISGKNSIIAERRKAEEERLREPPQPKAVEEKSGASDAAEQGEAKPVLSSPPVQSEQKRRQTPLPARPKVTDTQAEE